MKITADTNILIRAAVRDDPAQALIAEQLLRDAELVAVPLITLCEFVWVMRRMYKRSHTDIAIAIRSLTRAANVVTDQRGVMRGLAMLDAGGDFADGVIAADGTALGGEIFVTFDSQAVELLAAQRISALNAATNRS